MPMKKISRRKAYTIAALIFAAVIIAFLWRDLNLANRAGDIDLPDIIVENIEIDREINGKQWRLVSPRVEHREGIFYGDSLDVTITDPAGNITRVNAEKGVFTRASNDVEMTGADAFVKDKNGEFTLTAGRAEFKAETEQWFFSDGVILTDGKIKVEGKEGIYDTQRGKCIISNGGVITWKE